MGWEFRLDEHDDGPEARVDRRVIFEKLRLDDWEVVLHGEVRAHLRVGWWVSGFGVWLFRVQDSGFRAEKSGGPVSIRPPLSEV